MPSARASAAQPSRIIEAEAPAAWVPPLAERWMATLCVISAAHAIARTPRDRLRISGNLERVLRLSDAFGSTHDELERACAVLRQADEMVLWVAETTEG